MDDLAAEVMRHLTTTGACVEVAVVCRVFQEALAAPLDAEEAAAEHRWVVRRSRRVRRDPVLRLYHVELTEARVREDIAAELDEWPAPDEWRTLVSFESAEIALDCLLPRPVEVRTHTPALELVVDGVVLKAVEWSERAWAARALGSAIV